jgi:O-Antigen ligase
VPASSYEVAGPPGPAAIEELPAAEVKGRVVAGVRAYALTVAVALAVFALAIQSGGYSVTVRNSFAIAVWWAVALAVAAWVWPADRPPRAALVTGGALCAFVALTGVAIAWSDSAERAFTEFNRGAFYLGVFALVVVGSRRGSAGRWANGLAIGIGAIGLVALTSRLFPDLIGDRGVSSFFPAGIRYLGYPLDYWNGLGIFVALGLPLVLRMVLDARRSLSRALAVAPVPALVAALYLTSSRGGFATAALSLLLFLALTRERLRALVAVAVAGAGSAAAIAVLEARPELADGILRSDAVTSQGRSAAALIAGLCLLTAAAYALASRWSPAPPAVRLPRRVLIAGAVLLSGAAVVAANPGERLDSFKRPPSNPFAVARPAVSSTSEPSGGGTASSASSHLLSGGGNGRWQLWGAALDEFETRPIAGRGPGSYESWWAQHGSIAYFTRHAHSLYLQTMGELGLLGLALLLAFLAAPLPALRRRLRGAGPGDRNALAALAGVFGGFLFALGIDWMWELTAVTVVGVAAMALLTGPASLAPSDGAVERPRRGLAPVAARAGIVLAILGLIAAQGIPLIAQQKIQLSQERFAAGNLDGARDAAEAARGAQPWASSPHLQLSLVEERAGDLPAARAAIGKAIDRDPLDWRLWLTAARIDQEAGLVRSSRARLDRAVALNPRSPLFASASR